MLNEYHFGREKSYIVTQNCLRVNAWWWLVPDRVKVEEFQEGPTKRVRNRWRLDKRQEYQDEKSHSIFILV